MDIFGRFARDPACLVAIDAADGGRWRSQFRPGVAYPSSPSGTGSFEEQTGLLKKTNIKTSNGYFEPENLSIAARIDTPLDLRGRVSSYTSVVRFQPPGVFSSNSQKQELAGQGSAVGSNVAICALCYVRDSGEYKFQLSHEMSGGRRLLTVSPGYPLDPTRTYTAVALIQVGTGQTTMSIYLDGILLKSSVTAEVPLGTASAQFTNFAINDNRLGAWSNFFGKFHNLLLFDRALKSSELQLLR